MGNVDLAGYFMLPSGIIVVRGNYFETHRHFQAQAGGDNHFAQAVHELRRGAPLPEPVLDLLLTRRHEESHYRHLMSTPLGLLLWRAMNVLVVDANFLIRHVAGLRPDLWPPEPPLDGWLAGGGLDIFSHTLADGGVIDPAVGPSTRYRGQDLVRYMGFLVNEIRVIRVFLNGILERTTLKVGEFVAVANLAMEIMNRRSDLKAEAVWATRLPPESPLLPADAFAGNEIIEAAARFEEHQLLDFVALAPGMFEHWQRTRIFGVYQPAYEHLSRELRHLGAALAVIDVALMSPVDPAFAAVGGGTLIVEDLLPSLRLPRLIEAARDHFWPRDHTRWQGLLGRDLALAAGLALPDRVAEVGAGAVFSGESSWDYDARQRGNTTLGRPFVLAQEDVRRAMRKRLANPAVIVLREDQPDPIHPVITFFDDTALLGHAGIKEDWLVNVVLSYQKFVGDGIHLALLGQFNPAALERCETAILRRAREAAAVVRQGPAQPPTGAVSPFETYAAHLSEVERRGLFGVREIAARFVPASHLYLVGL